MTRNGFDAEPGLRAAGGDAALDAALADLAAAPPPVLSEAFLNRATEAARQAHLARAAAVRSPQRRGDSRSPGRARRGGERRIARGAVGLAASALLGFLVGWSDLMGVGAQGLADADLIADQALLASDWEDTL